MTQKNNILVSIVIPHLRGTEYLLNLLDDLKQEAMDVGRVEVLLVDNASTDGSSALAGEMHPWIKVLPLKKNLGYAGGCNHGIRSSRGKWIWLINDDIRIKPGSLRACLTIAESAPDIAAVQPKILSLIEEGKFDYAGGAGGMIDKYGYPFALGRIGGALETDEGQYDSSREIFWASGTACFWKRSVLKKIGLLDAFYFAHMEEIDLSWRAWTAGYRILSAPEAVVYHLGGGTLGYESWMKMYLNHRNALITLAKNRDFISLLGLLPARLVLDQGIGFVEFVSGRPKRIFAIWAGWLAFLRDTPHWLRSRKRLRIQKIRHTSDLDHIVYNGCILLAYVRGVHTASTLAK